MDPASSVPVPTSRKGSSPTRNSDKVRATHLLVRPDEEWNKLYERVQQDWASCNEHQLDTARAFHLIACASVARNILINPFEGAGITIDLAITNWGIATLSAGSCHPQQ